jgi:nicotinate phosphoribosyltransferase
MIESPLLTDLYQLTMAYGYWSRQQHQTQTVFELFYRQPPFEGHGVIACGLSSVIQYLQHWHWSEEDLSFLSTLRSDWGSALFSDSFLDYLRSVRFTGDIDAVSEGTVVFPHQPILRVKAPLLQAQILETVLLNQINFQTLIATKAARLCLAAGGSPVIEFGLRRAQGPNGGLSASRAAYIGGCAATSHVLAGQLYGIPLKGTHAHSWVMSFPHERDAFLAYARLYPENAFFLVDTYEVQQGIKHAIEAAKILAQEGIVFKGIRIDSGDLLLLSRQARSMLDDAGWYEAKILVSNQLDETSIQFLRAQDAQIDLWGVGTQLVTGGEVSALGGVYKMTALQNESGQWCYKAKLSQQVAKRSWPGIRQIRRYWHADHVQPVQDTLFEETLGLQSVPPVAGAIVEDLLQPIMREGKLCANFPSIHEMRVHSLRQSQIFFTQSISTYPIIIDDALVALRDKVYKDLEKLGMQGE